MRTVLSGGRLRSWRSGRLTRLEAGLAHIVPDPAHIISSPVSLLCKLIVYQVPNIQVPYHYVCKPGTSSSVFTNNHALDLSAPRTANLCPAQHTRGTSDSIGPARTGGAVRGRYGVRRGHRSRPLLPRPTQRARASGRRWRQHRP